MVLLEPNPFYLLEQAGRTAAWLEARALRDHVKRFGAPPATGTRAAERFADYWLGDGAWERDARDSRRAAFAECAAAELRTNGRRP